MSDLTDTRRYRTAHLLVFRWRNVRNLSERGLPRNIEKIREYTLLEIEHLVRAGMTEMEALIAATRTSADLCGVADRLGTVEVGKLADLIVVSANPLDNIRNIRELKYVFKGGSLVETDDPEGLGDFWELFFFD